MAAPGAIDAREPRLWRLHSDATNQAFLGRALAGRHYGRALKTDLFDEAVTEGLVPALRAAAGSITGIDRSPAMVDRASARHPGVEALTADVRRLPFDDGSFDLVVSISTLDHLAGVREIESAIQELARVLAPGGTLALSVDNLANPVIALRSILPGAPLRAAGLVAYPTGATVGPRRLRRFVRGAGLTPRMSAALMHCPRLPAVLAARRLERSPARHDRFLRRARAFEGLDRLPTRYLTGYFAAIVAEKQSPGSA